MAGGGSNPAHDFATAAGALVGTIGSTFIRIVVGLGGGGGTAVQGPLFSTLILMKLLVFALLAGLSPLFGVWCSLFTGTDFAAVGAAAGLFAFFPVVGSSITSCRLMDWVGVGEGADAKLVCVE